MGIAIVIAPFLGIPNSTKQWIFVILGTLVIIVGYRLRRQRYLRSLETHEGERRAEAFVENRAPIVSKSPREA
jgi:membrane protein implicated in regulation of membrane protease activity